MIQMNIRLSIRHRVLKFCACDLRASNLVSEMLSYRRASCSAGISLRRTMAMFSDMSRE